MRNHYILLVALLISFTINAQIIDIPDANFKNALIALGIDLNSDGEIQITEAEARTSLYLYNESISSLEGINAFVNLTQLTCANNPLSSLDISSLINLLELNCEDNQITSLEVNNNINLYALACQNNQLESLDLSSLPNLQFLECQNNQLTELDLTGNPILDELTIFNNQITSLDFSNLSNGIEYISANDNDLRFINFKNGIAENAYFWEGQGYYWYNNPNLSYICADESELSDATSWANSFNPGNVVVNTYCSFIVGGEYYPIEGNSIVDIDNNGCDANDSFASYINFAITNGTETGNFISNANGNYTFAVQEGTHTITPILENLDYFTVSPSTITVDFPEDESPYLQDFCITPNGTHNDIEIILIPLDEARPGFDANYKIVYKNKGTTTLSGSVDLTFQDNIMDFVSASPTEDSQSANMLSWNFTDLTPIETRAIFVNMNINTPMDTPPVNGDEVLIFDATVNSSETDETPDDNTSTLNQMVVNSFDPNDKTCLEGDFITPEMVGDYVHYMIRFENTGTASALNIVVKDDIDKTKYDLSSLVALDASHDFVARIKDNASDYYVEFIFENINLPFDDANNDGFVAFKIKTLDTLVLGDTFENNAEIYFDFNFPIVTNFAETTIATLSTEDFELANNSISLYPNPTTHSLTLESKQAIKHITIYDISGRNIKEIAVIGIKTELTISTEALSTGTYFVKIKTKSGETVRKIIKD